MRSSTKRNQNINKIIAAAQEVFPTRYYNIESRNFDSAIIIESRTNKCPGTSIWLRLEYSPDGLCINASSVNIARRKRRTGLFTDLMRTLGRLSFVKALRIGGVCTVAMKNWCQKHNFQPVKNCLADFILTGSNLKAWARERPQTVKTEITRILKDNAQQYGRIHIVGPHEHAIACINHANGKILSQKFYPADRQKDIENSHIKTVYFEKYNQHIDYILTLRKEPDNMPETQVQRILAKQHAINTPPRPKCYQDADTVLADVLETIDTEVSGTATELLTLYQESDNKELIEKIFEMLTGTTWTELLELMESTLDKQ